MPLPRLIVTPGEPAGIGGEILLKAIAAGAHNLVTLDDPQRLHDLASAMGISLKATVVDTIEDAAHLPTNQLAILPITWPEPPVAGQPSAANGQMVIDTITQGAELARDHKVLALVTNPIQKSSLYAAGFDCPGHTEYLARIDGDQVKPVMMLYSEMLKVVPLTIHEPLSAVPGLITPELIETTAGIVDDALRRDFNLATPRIAVAGLNPHAGENGTIGREEEEIIRPALERLQRLGMHITGPYSADTLFHEERRQEYDAVIAMYHDQALVPIKTLDFHRGVNTTLGLSYIRTSPDHGTALNQAGQYTANSASLEHAIQLAFSMAANRHRRDA